RAGSDGVRIESIDLIDIASISARDELLKPLSWRLNFGAARKRIATDVEPLIVHLKGGAGFASEDRWGSLWYALLETELDANSHLERGYALGVGPSAGVLFDVGSRWR